MAAVDVEGASVEVLTPQEVAAFLRISPRTTYRYLREGQIPSFRVGRSIRVRKRDLDSWEGVDS